jgi:hypothetical protein
MTKPDFDWTFEDTPLEGEGRPASAGGPERRQSRWYAPRRKREPWPRWAWLALFGLAASVIAGAYVFTRLGWQRVEQQIVAEVAYDDARSRAGEVEAVLAAQVSNDAYWRAERAAEVELRLPAPLPAGNLLPTVDPAEVIKVEALGGGLFAATVRRRYADVAGQVVSFDLVQRYLNLAPGEWQRLGTDLSGLRAATIVQGQRMSATVPTNDLPWLRPALVAADLALSEACDAWQSCPDGYLLPLYFNAGPELLHPARPERPAELSPAAVDDPIIFDIPASTASYPPQFRLSAPQVVGRPADEAAQAAYTRALSVRVLGEMAGLITQAGRGSNDYFLDAIVARMEVKLGLSAAAVSEPGPLNFLPAEVLWRRWQPPTGTPSTGDRNDRRQALRLMNAVLEGQPAEVEGALLRAIHRPDAQTFGYWLATALGQAAAAQAVDRWQAAAQQALEPAAPDAWQAAEGLALMCADQLALVEGGVLRPVGAVFGPVQSRVVALQRSLGTGRYLAANYFSVQGGSQSAVEQIELWVVDRTGAAEPVRASEYGLGLGWGADGALYFFSIDQTDSGAGASLQRYDPATGRTSIVAEAGWYIYSLESVWTRAHDALLVQLETSTGDFGEVTMTPMLLTVGPPAVMRPLIDNAYSAVFAPGSTTEQGQVAFLRNIYTFGEAGSRLEIHVLDLATRADRLLFDSAQVDGDPAAGAGALVWSPGGAWLAVIGYGGSGPRFFVVNAASGEVRDWPPSDGGLTGANFYPMGFSADDHYLALRAYADLDESAQIALLDLTAPAVTPRLMLNGEGLAWAPSGHRLALSNALGVFLVDAATGEYEWLQAESCALDW